LLLFLFSYEKAKEEKETSNISVSPFLLAAVRLIY
jgi:hypothetical protein